MDRYTLLYLKSVTNKDLLYSPGNSAQCGLRQQLAFQTLTCKDPASTTTFWA